MGGDCLRGARDLLLVASHQRLPNSTQRAEYVDDGVTWRYTPQLDHLPAFQSSLSTYQQNIDSLYLGSRR